MVEQENEKVSTCSIAVVLGFNEQIKPTINEKRRRWIEADIGWYRGSANRLRNSGSFHLDFIWVKQLAMRKDIVNQVRKDLAVRAVAEAGIERN